MREQAEWEWNNVVGPLPLSPVMSGALPTAAPGSFLPDCDVPLPSVEQSSPSPASMRSHSDTSSSSSHRRSIQSREASQDIEGLSQQPVRSAESSLSRSFADLSVLSRVASQEAELLRLSQEVSRLSQEVSRLSQRTSNEPQQASDGSEKATNESQEALGMSKMASDDAGEASTPAPETPSSEAQAEPISSDLKGKTTTRSRSRSGSSKARSNSPDEADDDDVLRFSRSPSPLNLSSGFARPLSTAEISRQSGLSQSVEPEDTQSMPRGLSMMPRALPTIPDLVSPLNTDVEKLLGLRSGASGSSSGSGLGFGSSLGARTKVPADIDGSSEVGNSSVAGASKKRSVGPASYVTQSAVGSPVGGVSTPGDADDEESRRASVARA
ncbi:hypothetical protein QBC40DRAFT_16977 [Triangularia verruculosa]|uniref:Uncharacterized protein n=1 Tax=Triangularia verruculosa TaxID=2587418 RepID=A0AAN6XMT4_9PEZI|nr:hypothetical protein QBC40DRAFT_16977 [Triangularia verruculosa]